MYSELLVLILLGWAYCAFFLLQIHIIIYDIHILIHMQTMVMYQKCHLNLVTFFVPQFSHVKQILYATFNNNNDDLLFAIAA